jgi:protein-tyrosine kinase
MQIIGRIPRIEAGRPSVAQQGELVDGFVQLRRALRSFVVPNQPYALSMSSRHPAEGTTFIAANLGLSFGEAGFRTVLIDGDARRDGLARVFSVDRQPGLVEYCNGTVSHTGVIHATAYERCFAVPFGLGDRVPSAFTDVSVRRLFEELRAQFDVIIVDCPSPGRDMVVQSLAMQTDGVLTVRRTDMHADEGSPSNHAALDDVPIRAFGVVLNCVDSRL